MIFPGKMKDIYCNSGQVCFAGFCTLLVCLSHFGLPPTLLYCAPRLAGSRIFYISVVACPARPQATDSGYRLMDE
ncbi:MAG: hypothetical protein LBB51_01260, partial [Zoogloeaceae bacterium]|nr:hypothetical protein [Zoogloeaceae bacterium]